MNYHLLLLLLIANIPLYFFIAWVLFKRWRDFVEDVKYLSAPSWYWKLRGERWDFWAGSKLVLFVFSCVAAVFLEYKLIMYIASKF
jgi:hypothetical protein